MTEQFPDPAIIQMIQECNEQRGTQHTIARLRELQDTVLRIIGDPETAAAILKQSHLMLMLRASSDNTTDVIEAYLELVRARATAVPAAWYCAAINGIEMLFNCANSCNLTFPYPMFFRELAELGASEAGFENPMLHAASFARRHGWQSCATRATEKPWEEKWSSTGQALSSWKRSPFPILVCMSFHTPPIVPHVWKTSIEPVVSEMGPVIRIDWTTDDWVEDLREAVSDSAFVLLDLTSTNWNVSRELKYLRDMDIPVFAYMNGQDESNSRITTIGQVCPQLAVTDANGNVDSDVLTFPLRMAPYDQPAEVEKLCEEIRNTLLPLQDKVDPSAAYVGSDVSQMHADEQRGLDLARVPRSRIIAVSEYLKRTNGRDYWANARKLVLDSAIYRARVFSWFANPNLQIHTSGNLWIRENLLCSVLDTVRDGNKLTEDEQDIIRRMMSRETVEDIAIECGQILTASQTATRRPPALERGMPMVPRRIRQPAMRERIKVRLDLRPDAAAQLLRAENWDESIPDPLERLTRVLTKSSGIFTRPRCFDVESIGGPSGSYEGECGQIEDKLDAAAQRLKPLIVQAKAAGWDDREVGDLIRAVTSVTVLQEVARQDVARWKQAGGTDDFAQRLMSHFAHIWGVAVEDQRLFEFQSDTDHCNFRGLLPWSDLRELVATVYASVVSPMLGESEENVRRSILSWDLPPSEPWDLVIVQRWGDLLANPNTRRAWCRFAIPSAVFYWDVRRVFVDPGRVDRWAYVLGD